METEKKEEIKRRLTILEEELVYLLSDKEVGDKLTQEQCDIMDALFEIREIIEED